MIAPKRRSAPPNDAVAECRRALEWLRAAGAGCFFWKYCSTFDSKPEGNIGPVAETLMKDPGTDLTIYCPAFPESGRTVFMENLFVGRGEPRRSSPIIVDLGGVPAPAQARHPCRPAREGKAP